METIETLTQFTHTYRDDIVLFVEKYDGLYRELQELENSLQDLLAKQKAVVESLQNTRQDEEDFFDNAAEKLGVDPTHLKKMAATWASGQTS